MKAAILSAGPSLRQTFNPDEHFDVRIGVNAAAKFYCCDYWSCGDGRTFREITPVGYPVVFTMSHVDGQLKADRHTVERLKKHRVIEWSEVSKQVIPPVGWSNWSITAAVPLAVSLGATEIHVYGHDLVGTVDVAGRNLKCREQRFRSGQHTNVPDDWRTIREWASDRGVVTLEHQPEAAPCV